jgi:hypothetical protein
MPDRGGTSEISSLFYILTQKKARKIWTFSALRDKVKALAGTVCLSRQARRKR